MFNNYEQWAAAIQTAANREFQTDAETNIVLDLALERVGRRVRVPENNDLVEFTINAEISDLPQMCRHVRAVEVQRNGKWVTLRRVMPTQINNYNVAGFPSVFCVRGNRDIQIRAIPNGQLFRFDYYLQPTFSKRGRIDLVDFLESYQSLFLYAGLVELYGVIVKDHENYTLALNQFEAEVANANAEADRMRTSGAVMRAS